MNVRWVEAGLFGDLAQGNALYIAVTISVPARLKPLIMLFVMQQQDMIACGVYHPRRSSDMTGPEIAVKAIIVLLDKIEVRRTYAASSAKRVR